MDRIAEIKKEVNDLLEEGELLVKRRAAGLPDSRTDEVQEDNVVLFPYRERAHVNLKQRPLDTAHGRRTYPH